MNTSLIIIAAIVLFIAFFIIRARVVMKNTPLVDDHEKILKLTDKNFQHQTRNKTVLVDFWAAWCAPCRMMAPVLNEIAEELPDSVKVGKVDVEQYQILAQKFRIRGIPTMVLLRNGVEIERFTGVRSKDFLLQKIKNL